MGNLNLSFRKGYFRLHPDNVDFSPPKDSPYKPHKAILWGGNLYHAYNCGDFTLYDQPWCLVFAFLCRNSLPDTLGQCVEHIDMDVTTTDRITSNALFAKVAAGEEIVPNDLSFAAQSIQDAINREADGLSYDEFYPVFERYIYGLTNEFMGTTFAEVVDRFPSILQPVTVTDDDGNEHNQDNIWRNCFEEPL